MSPDQIIPDKNNRAAIILAGGEGTRLAELTRRGDGVHVPKQFCAVFGEVSLLDQTRRRVSLSVPSERVSFVLNRDHERFFSPLLADVFAENLIIQPQNRGTAPAILYALLRLAESAPRASVLLMPSDHHVGEEAALMKYVDLAFAAVEKRPHLSVLVGIAPDEPETAYGWIEPAPPTGLGECNTLPVRRFWEKPSREVARQLMAAGCFWNSFMMVGQLRTLLGLFTLAMPELYISFSKIRPSLGTLFEEEILGRLYEGLRPSDFSRRVLESAAPSFNVLPVSNVGWSDLGEPHRVAKALAGLGVQRKQVAA
jgi:mannose-1-phosphate guanylyltransferase